MDWVNHPNHYRSACPLGRQLMSHFDVFSESDFDQECDIVMADRRWNESAYLYNAAKYLWRCESKGSLIVDLGKALWYLRRWEDVRQSNPKLAGVDIDARRVIAAIELVIAEQRRSVSVSAPGLSLMVSFALRYAYDRKTAAAHAIIGQVLPIFSQLPTADQRQIRREIARELNDGGICDPNRVDWERFLEKTGGRAVE